MPEARRYGRDNRLTGQIGEYLVAAELARRRGLIATTFAGNVPHFDIVASDVRGRHVSVQVKTSNASSWQFSLDRFCEVSFLGKRQILGSLVLPPVRRLVVVLVMLGGDDERDRFFVCSWIQLRNLAVRNHRAWLREHRGRRPKNPFSLHTVVSMSEVEGFENCWATVDRSLR
jgi:hypothetical protein